MNQVRIFPNELWSFNSQILCLGSKVPKSQEFWSLFQFRKITIILDEELIGNDFRLLIIPSLLTPSCVAHITEWKKAESTSDPSIIACPKSCKRYDVLYLKVDDVGWTLFVLLAILVLFWTIRVLHYNVELFFRNIGSTLINITMCMYGKGSIEWST